MGENHPQCREKILKKSPISRYLKSEINFGKILQLKRDKNFGGDFFHLRPSSWSALLVTFVARDKSNASTASGEKLIIKEGLYLKNETNHFASSKPTISPKIKVAGKESPIGQTSVAPSTKY